MPKIVVMDVEELTEIIKKVMFDALKASLPNLLERATRKPYLTREELMNLTGWRARTPHHLQDTNRIPCVQHGRKMLYPTEKTHEIV